jgi:hypothetical protein
MFEPWAVPGDFDGFLLTRDLKEKVAADRFFKFCEGLSTMVCPFLPETSLPL